MSRSIIELVPVIASAVKQSRAASEDLDRFDASLLAMTIL